MKAFIYTSQGGVTSLTVDDLDDDYALLMTVDCAGNSLATAAFLNIPNGARRLKARIAANYISASNFGFVVPQPYINPVRVIAMPIEYDIWANGPNGSSITAYLSSGTFVDGSTSLSIPCGHGKILSPVNINLSAPVWGVIG